MVFFLGQQPEWAQDALPALLDPLRPSLVSGLPLPRAILMGRGPQGLSTPCLTATHQPYSLPGQEPALGPAVAPFAKVSR